VLADDTRSFRRSIVNCLALALFSNSKIPTKFDPRSMND